MRDQANHRSMRPRAALSLLGTAGVAALGLLGTMPALGQELDRLPANVGIEPVPVMINGQRLESDAVMFTRSARTLLPMRSLFTSLGARVEWDARERAVYAWKPDGSGVRFAVGEHRVQTLRMARDPFPGNWGQVIRSHPLDTPAQVLGSRVYVPLRAASEALTADVKWVSAPPTVRIYTERVADAPPVEYRDPDRPAPRRSEPLTEEERERLRLEKLRVERLREERLREERLRERERERKGEVEPPVERDVPGEVLTRPAVVARSLKVTLSLPEPKDEDAIPLRLVVQNTGTQPVSLNFRNGQQFDFEVLQNGQVIWNWAHDRMFTQALSALTLKPGERIAFQTTWNQMTNTGRIARPGEYTVRGFLNASAEVLRLEAREEFELER